MTCQIPATAIQLTQAVRLAGENKKPVHGSPLDSKAATSVTCPPTTERSQGKGSNERILDPLRTDGPSKDGEEEKQEVESAASVKSADSSIKDKSAQSPTEGSSTSFDGAPDGETTPSNNLNSQGKQPSVESEDE